MFFKCSRMIESTWEMRQDSNKTTAFGDPQCGLWSLVRSSLSNSINEVKMLCLHLTGFLWGVELLCEKVLCKPLSANNNNKQFMCTKFLSHVKHGSTSHVSVQLMPTTTYEVGGIIIPIFRMRKPRHGEVWLLA